MKRIIVMAAALAVLVAPGAARAETQSVYTCEGPMVLAAGTTRTTSCTQDLVPGTRRFKVLWSPGARGAFRLDVTRPDGFSLGSYACSFVPNDVRCDTTGSLEGGTAVHDTGSAVLTRGQYQAYVDLAEAAVVTFTTDGTPGPTSNAKTAVGAIRLEGS